MHFAPEFVVADRFRLISLIGQGGMGAVWLAHHLSLDVRCAIKFIHPEVAKSPGLLARFEREAKAIAQIQGRHVVKVFDRGVWNDVPYIAMEYLVGEDLERRLRRVRRLSPLATFTVLSDVCRALAKAHALGLVHRDLKPGNIFLFQDDDREIAKVLDFGIAKDTNLAPDVATKAGALLGTPYYMSPEQWRADRTVDSRADLWSLGVIAFQCLTGALPFNGQALGELFMKVMVDPLPVPSQVSDAPPGFDPWWAQAMQRDPALRFQTAKDAMAALATALSISASMLAEPVGAGAPTSAAPAGPGTYAPGSLPGSAGTPVPSSGPGNAGTTLPSASPVSVRTPSPSTAPATVRTPAPNTSPGLPMPEFEAGTAGTPSQDNLATIVLPSGDAQAVTTADAPGVPSGPLGITTIPGVPKHSGAPLAMAVVIGTVLGLLALYAALKFASPTAPPTAPARTAPSAAASSVAAPRATAVPTAPPAPSTMSEPAAPAAPTTIASERPVAATATPTRVPGPLPTARRSTPAKADRPAAPSAASEGIF